MQTQPITNTQQAFDFVQTLSKYLRDFNFMLVKQGDKLSLCHQVTGETKEFSDSTFPIIYQGPEQSLPPTLNPYSFPFLSSRMETPVSVNPMEFLPDELNSEPDVLPTSVVDHSYTEEHQTPEPLERLAIPFVESDLAPNMMGQYFALESPLAQNQQRERIAICPPSSYPRLISTVAPPEIPCLVVTDVLTWRCSPSKAIRQQSSVDAWPHDADGLELHPKTPDLLSNNMDKDSDKPTGHTGFFFHFKIFCWQEDTQSYQLLDQLTSSTFRTVSHSKLCDSKRRATGRKTKVPKSSRKSERDDSFSSERYDPY